MEISSKKLKVEENGTAKSSPSSNLTLPDARKIIESFTQNQLADIISNAVCLNNPVVLESVRRIADRDPVHRKLFIRGLGWDTTTDKIRSVFSDYGEISEAAVILDKSTGKGKGYGFVTFRHVDAAVLALKDPNKKIDGRMTTAQLAAAGAPSSDSSSLRKIFVGNVAADMAHDRLRAFFGSFGEIEEGPLGFDKETGRFKGYALFIYKTVEGARAAVVDPLKSLDGIGLQCELVIHGK